MAGVGILHEQATRDLLHHGLGRGGVDFDEAEILFGGEDGDGFRGEGRSGNGFNKELRDGGCGVCVYFAVDADDASEG